MIKAADIATGRWPQILTSFGVDSERLVNKHGPCPVCEGKDRWRFDNKEGKGTWYCNSCGAGDGFKLLNLLHGWEFKIAARKIEDLLGRVEPQEFKQPTKPDPRIRLRKLASELIPASECPAVVEYLANRGLTPVEGLKAHPGIEYWENGRKRAKFPALVAMVQDAKGKPLTYHLTHIQNGHKANVRASRKILPPIHPTAGGAVRVGEFIRSEIGIAEGIETAMAAEAMYGLPTWAALNTNGIKTFNPPEFVKSLTIYADNDANYAGQAAAYALAHRLKTRRDIDVVVTWPDTVGTDFNDELLKQQPMRAVL